MIKTIEMRKYLLTSIFCLVGIMLFAQNGNLTKDDLDKELKPLKIQMENFQKDNSLLKTNIQNLQSENTKLKTEIGNLNTLLSDATNSIDSLKNQTEINSKSITETADKLGIEIKETNDKSQNKISEISQSLSKKSLYGIIGVLLAILVSGIIYWLLSRRQKTDKSEVIEQLSQTKTSIEESLVKEFGKQTDLIGSQLLLLEKQKAEAPANPNTEPDHSLALKVASEINLIERNINLMDAGTKGLKQLSRSVGKLKDNLAANGYEMPELLGKQFHQGMKVIVASSIPDENLEKGSEIITKVLIPQVNYNEKMIQTAQIEVSVGI
ncbi:hypothetical protein [Chryseobacterium indologenes]|uniref:hypothetical protein n=2 Tax=Bacteroidota/Chlorobiota group TaxID=68336 RepID=UPI001E54BDF9|nr:hypothetical protein [Chryseobacterium indologenes]